MRHCPGLNRTINKAITGADALEAERVLYGRSLRAFYRRAWKLIDPSDYVGNWHIDAICDHLHAVVDGDIQWLIINQPPRTGKSQLVSVSFPCWTWIKKPGLKFLSISFSRDLSTRDSVGSRRLIQSPWYQNRWDDRFSLLQDGNLKQRYSNNQGGSRIASSIEGGVTGDGADILNIDDPYNARRAYTKKEQQNVWDAWLTGIRNRLNPNGLRARIFIMQRFVDDDICGRIIDEMGGELSHLILPMEYVKHPKYKCSTQLNFVDPRTEDGELLCPDLYPQKVVDEFKDNQIIWSGQYQQDPAPIEGRLFDLSAVTRWSEIHASRYNVTIYADCAASESDSADYTVFLAVCEVKTDKKLYCIDMIRGQWRINVSELKLRGFVDDLYERGFVATKLVIENASNGAALIQIINDAPIRLSRQILIRATKIDRKEGKLMRSIEAKGGLESGSLLLPPGEAGDQIIRELSEFNEEMTHPHDDICDCVFDAINMRGKKTVGNRLRDQSR